jgi:hypothetical protein
VCRLDYIPSRKADLGSRRTPWRSRRQSSRSNGKPDRKHNIEAMREAYYERLAKHDMSPLWKVMGAHRPR